MGHTNETRLADARRREAEAREEYEAAVAEVAAHPGKRRGWRARQERASKAFHAHSAALAELDAVQVAAGAQVAAGVREAVPVAGEAEDCVLLVALVRVPKRAFAAMCYGSTSPAEMIEEGIAIRHRLDFDLYDDDPPERREWVETVRARFGAAPEDADAFRCVQVAAVDPNGDAARAIANALTGEG